MGTISYILKVTAFAIFYLLFAKWAGFEEAAIILLAQIFYKVIEISYKQESGNQNEFI